MRRKTPADYHALAEARGFRWLGPEVPSTTYKTGWQCQRGHRWQARYSQIQGGRGCPRCSRSSPKTPADYHALAKSRSFRWLGPEVPNTLTKTTWECEHGHQWQACYSNIQQGGKCPFCRRRARKTPADYHALAETRGFRWLGPEVPSTAHKTGWQCQHGHRWQARYSKIKDGSGCPHCSRSVPKTPADYHALAEACGFRWLGPEVSSTAHRTGWQCQHGHQWQARYNAIRRGSGCPVCAGTVPKTPADYHALAEARGFRWLGPEVPNIQTPTVWECPHGHRWKTQYHTIQQGSGCPRCYHRSRRKTPADYHALAETCGFRWLGPEVPNTQTKTVWECAHGHRWEALYNAIRQGSGCPVCAGRTPKPLPDPDPAT